MLKTFVELKILQNPNSLYADFKKHILKIIFCYIHILLGMFSTRVHKMNSGHLEQREIDDKYIQKTLHRYLVVYRNSDFHIIMLIVSPA